MHPSSLRPALLAGCLLLLLLQAAVPSSVPTPVPSPAVTFGGGVASPPGPPPLTDSFSPTLISQRSRDIGSTPPPFTSPTPIPVVQSPTNLPSPAPTRAPTLGQTSWPTAQIVAGTTYTQMAGSGLVLQTLTAPPLFLGRSVSSATAAAQARNDATSAVSKLKTKSTKPKASASILSLSASSMYAEFRDFKAAFKKSAASKASIATRKLQQNVAPTMMPTTAGMPQYNSFFATNTFTGLGQPSVQGANRPQWFLQIELYDTGFGGDAMPRTLPDNAPPNVKQEVAFYLRSDATGYQLLKRCHPLTKIPNGQCPASDNNVRFFDCVKDFDATALVQDAFGGSLQIYMASEGFSTTTCKMNVPSSSADATSMPNVLPVPSPGLSRVAARYTIRAVYPNPTLPPVATPDHAHDHAHKDHALHEEEADDYYSEGDDDHKGDEIHLAADAIEIAESHGVPLEALSIPIGFFVYLLMGIRILIVRGYYHSYNMTPVHGGAVLLYFAVLGIHLCLEITLGAVLVHSHWDISLGWGIIFSRLFCWVPSFYILGTVFHTGFYEKRLDEEQLSANVITYGLFNLFVISDTQLLSYFPWAATAFTKRNYGLPDIERVHFTLWPKLCQLLVSLVCTAIFLSHLNSEIKWVEGQAYTHDDAYHHGYDDHTTDDHAHAHDDHGHHTDDHGLLHHDDVYHHEWDDLHHHFLGHLYMLRDLVCLVLSFTVILMVSVAYSVLKHYDMIQPEQAYTPDLYDDTQEKEAHRRASESGDNRFMRRSMEMQQQNPLQMPAQQRMSISNHTPQLGDQDHQPQPPHPYGLQDRRPSFEAGPRMSISGQQSGGFQNQLTASSFHGRASLDGRRSSLGSPGSRRPSFDSRLPVSPPPGHLSPFAPPPPGYHQQ